MALGDFFRKLWEQDKKIGGSLFDALVEQPISDAYWSVTHPIDRLRGRGRAAEQTMMVPMGPIHGMPGYQIVRGSPGEDYLNYQGYTETIPERGPLSYWNQETGDIENWSRGRARKRGYQPVNPAQVYYNAVDPEGKPVGSLTADIHPDKVYFGETYVKPELKNSPIFMALMKQGLKVAPEKPASADFANRRLGGLMALLAKRSGRKLAMEPDRVLRLQEEFKTRQAVRREQRKRGEKPTNPERPDFDFYDEGAMSDFDLDIPLPSYRPFTDNEIARQLMEEQARTNNLMGMRRNREMDMEAAVRERQRVYGIRQESMPLRVQPPVGRPNPLSRQEGLNERLARVEASTQAEARRRTIAALLARERPQQWRTIPQHSDPEVLAAQEAYRRGYELERKRSYLRRIAREGEEFTRRRGGR